MAKEFHMEPNRVRIVDGSYTVFDTDAKSFCQVPDAVKTIDPFTLTIPDFAHKGYLYRHGRQPGADGLNRTYEVCRTLAKVNAEETAFADIDLGALPDGTDYLETRVKLSRTTSPPNIWGSLGGPVATGPYPWPTAIQPNQWMQLIGNAMVIEAGQNWKRLFWIEIVAGRAVLKRKQSVGAHGFVSGQIEAKANLHNVNANDELREGDSNHCSFVNSNNYTSVYTGILEITPCSYRSPS